MNLWLEYNAGDSEGRESEFDIKIWLIINMINQITIIIHILACCRYIRVRHCITCNTFSEWKKSGR